jgi:hypothetical protein
VGLYLLLVNQIAQDIVDHFNNREIEGKGMIVCMSRRIAAKMYELIRQNPDATETAVVITKEEVEDIFGFTEKERPKISIYIREKFSQTQLQIKQHL